MAVQRLSDPVNEGSTKVVEFDILDQDQEGVPATDLSTATLRLWDEATYASGGSPVVGILNGRDGQDVLNANSVTIDSDGHVVWTMQPEDTGEPSGLSENQRNNRLRRQRWRHFALFAFTWATGAYQQEIEIEVVNLRGAA